MNGGERHSGFAIDPLEGSEWEMIEHLSLQAKCNVQHWTMRSCIRRKVKDGIDAICIGIYLL